MKNEAYEQFLPLVTWYTPPEPRQLPTLVWSLLDQLQSPYEFIPLKSNLAAGKGTINPYPYNPERGATELLADESQRLRAAELYWVPDNMTEFIRRAGLTLPDWGVRPGDPPSPAGFVMYAKPFGGYISELNQTPIPMVAMSWGPTRFATSADSNVWVTFWSATNYEVLAEHLYQVGPSIGAKLTRPQALQQAYAQTADLQWDNEAVLGLLADPGNRPVVMESSFGYQDVDISEADMVSRTSAPWVNVLRATWLLMKQPNMVELTDEHLPRNLRRQAERRHADGRSVNTSPVRVVNMHRQRVTRASGGTVRGEYSHTIQYPVKGHWREQPYPTRGTVERIWIDAHWRGPEDAPVKVAKSFQVNVLNRPGS